MLSGLVAGPSSVARSLNPLPSADAVRTIGRIQVSQLSSQSASFSGCCPDSSSTNPCTAKIFHPPFQRQHRFRFSVCTSFPSILPDLPIICLKQIANLCFQRERTESGLPFHPQTMHPDVLSGKDSGYRQAFRADVFSGTLNMSRWHGRKMWSCRRSRQDWRHRRGG